MKTLRMVPAEEIQVGMKISLPRYFQTVTVIDVTPWNLVDLPGYPVLMFTVDPPRILPGMRASSTALPAYEGEQFIVVEGEFE